MKHVVFCFIVLQQIAFEIIQAQSFSFNSPHVQFDSRNEIEREKPLSLYQFHQYENGLPSNHENTGSVYDGVLKPYRSKNDINFNFNNAEQKYPYHILNTWNRNASPSNVNQIPYVIYNSGNQPVKNSNNGYLSGIISKAGDAVKATADENHNAFKNSVDSLVAAGVANTNAGKDLIQSGLIFGSSFPRFGSKFFG